MSRRRTTVPAGAAENAPDAPPAAASLRAARRVLVTGLADAPLATVQAACDVAEGLNAAICPGDTDVASPLGPVLIRAGDVTADVAELRDRADLVIAWFCDPDSLRPGFAHEFLAARPGGPATRSVLAVGPEPVAGASRHLPLPLRTAVDAARLLHARLLGHAAAPDNAAAAAIGATCDELVTAIRAARCVAFLTCRDGDPAGLFAWATRQLVRQIAHERPAFAVPLPGRSAADGPAGTVLTWRYGAAGAIARADRLGGAFRPAECSAAALVARDEVDAVLAVGPLTPEVEGAITARGAGLVVVRIDAGDRDSLTAVLRDLRERPDERAVR